MRAGRKPLPTSLKRLKGTLNVTRINRHEPTPSPLSTIAPRDLPPDVREVWDGIAAQLDGARILTEIDDKALRVLAETWVKYRDLVTKSREMSPVAKGRDGVPIVSPVLRAQLLLQRELLNLLTEFGMTPSSRARIAARPPSPIDADPWSRY